METGEFDILIGRSSQEIVLTERVTVESTVELAKSYTRNSTVGDLTRDPNGAAIIQSMMSQAGGMMAMMQDGSDIMMAMMQNMPLRALIAFSGGALTEQGLDDLLNHLNH